MNTPPSPLLVAKALILLAGSALLLGATQITGAADAAPAATPAASSAEATAAPHKEAATASAAPAPGGAVAVKKGDTLRKISARSLGHLPLKPEILHSAVMQKNPAAFKNGKPESLAAGSVLQMPTMEDFRRFIPAVAAVCQESEGSDGARADAAADPRKGWVRFP